MKKMLLAGLLALPMAFAQVTGEFGRKMAMTGSYGQGAQIFGILCWILLIGLTLLVWLLVIKNWKEVRKKK